MFCKNCGTKIEDGAVFCGNCGTPVEKADSPAEATVSETPVAETPVEEKAPVVETPVAETPVEPAAETPVQPAPETPVQPAQPAAPAPEKEKGKLSKVLGNKLILVAAAVAVIAVLVLCNLKAVGNTVRKLFLPGEKYLAYVVKDNAEELVSNALNIYDAYLSSAKAPNNTKGTVSASLVLGEKADSLFKSLDDAAEYVEWIKKVNLDYSINSHKSGMELAAKVGVNGNDLLSFDMLTDYKGIYMQIPELSKYYLGMEYEGFEDAEVEDSMEQLAKLIDACPSKADLNKVSKKYIKAALNGLGKVKKESGKDVKAKDVSVKTTLLKLDLSDELELNIAKEVLEVFIEDKELKEILSKSYKSMGEIAEEYGSDMDFDEIYDKAIEEAEASLEEIKERLDDDDLGETYGKLKVYVDSKGKIVGLALEADFFGEISYKHPVKGGNFGFEISFGGFEITGKGKESDSNISGTFNIEASGSDICSFEVKKFDKSIYKKGKGKYEIVFDKLASVGNVSSYINRLERNTGIPASLVKKVLDSGIVFSGSISPTAYDFGISFGSGNDQLLAITLGAKVDNASKVSAPSGKSVIECEEDDMDDAMEEYLESVKGDTIIKALKKAKAPDDIIDAAEEFFDDIEDFDPSMLLGNKAVPYYY